MMTRDEEYCKLIIDAMTVCESYRPKLGHGGKGYDLDEFRTLYGGDCFYSWFGLDSPLVYAAQRAAGGITSVYRQIGTGCERLFRKVLQDELGLDKDDSTWSYELPTRRGGKTRRLTLDARIPLAALANPGRKKTVTKWVTEVGRRLGLEPKIIRRKQGAVFEIRQGYKSKDSKRQNADITNAANAHAYDYLPVIAVFSNQIDEDLVRRYQDNRILVLRGIVGTDSTVSTYAFVKSIIGYDLAAFFERNSDTIKEKITSVLERLISTR